MTMTNEQPNKEQLAALRAFARREGRCWKQALRDAWMSGIYPAHAQSGYLQQVRNELGPSWLVGFQPEARKLPVCWKCGRAIRDAEHTQEQDGTAGHLNACPAR